MKGLRIHKTHKMKEKFFLKYSWTPEVCVIECGFNSQMIRTEYCRWRKNILMGDFKRTLCLLMLPYLSILVIHDELAEQKVCNLNWLRNVSWNMSYIWWGFFAWSLRGISRKKHRGLSCFTINSEWMALFKSISIGRTPELPLKTLPEIDCIAESGL